ncbi:SH3 domain-containing protein [Paeniroseomonas aquatica]|uniref:SH3 domain-containing protein n=1 Tax=Paeniroseomonas aquatica TaxID=373043 RepID=A0ABT8ACF0_9PROT|nr:SH3 domain-containing protein [Paeniroseomonas aquatica]MDN3567193.1 SH3 domain-containing protein [Paeniroseomonas aquatica]
MGLALAAVALAAGSGAMLLRPQEAGSATGVVPPAAEAGYVAAAEAALRSRLRQAEALEFGPAAVFRFGPEDERAVCGTVQAAGGPASPYVMRVLLPRGATGLAPRYVTVMEQGPGLVHADAQAPGRYCRDGAALAVDAAAPPAAAPVPEPAARATEAAATAPEKVVVRSPARLRAAPGGEVRRIAAAGEALGVFGRAPGGWLQVGSTGAEGWVHASLLAEVH